MSSDDRKRPLRVTFLHAAGYGSLAGGFRVVVEYAHAMQKRGHKVTLVGRPKRPKRQFTTPPLSKLPVTKDPIYYDDFLRGKDLDNRVIDHHGPITAEHVPDADIIIGSWYETVPWMAAMPPSKGIPIHFVQHHEVINVQNYDPDGSRAEFVRSVHRIPMARITIADWLDDVLRTEYQTPHFRQITNGVDTELFSAPERAKQATPTVGFLCSGAKFKRTRALADQLEILREELGALNIVAFGSPAEDQARELMPEGTEYFRSPPQDRIREVYGRCDAWAVGSSFEGFHLIPLEAMACRTPVVATRVGGAVEPVEHGENGYLADPDNLGGLRGYLKKVLTATPDEWARMSEAAHATALSYDWGTRHEAFEEALYAAVEGRF